MHMDIGAHVADDVLEKYLLNRLPEPELAAVEEHLLVCPACQTKAEETDEFILAAKAALHEVKRRPTARALHASAGILQSWFTLPVLAVVMASIAAAIFLPSQHKGARSAPSEIHLSALRGHTVNPAHARAAGGLILDLDTTGLPGDGNYAVTIVEATGAAVWTGASRPSANSLQAVIEQPLPPGRYWIRLSRGGKSVREYGLQID